MTLFDNLPLALSLARSLNKIIWKNKLVQTPCTVIDAFISCSYRETMSDVKHYRQMCSVQFVSQLLVEFANLLCEKVEAFLQLHYFDRINNSKQFDA